MDGNLDGIVEIVTRSPDGLYAYLEDGTQIAFFQGIFPGGAIVPIRETGDGDRIAWIAYGPNGISQWLVIVSYAGLSTPVFLGDLGVVAAAAADLNGDGLDDLLLSQQSVGEVKILVNARNASFDPDEPANLDWIVGPPGPAPTNVAIPVTADLDSDGDTDAGFASHGDQTFHVLENTLVQNDRRVPGIMELRFDLDDMTNQAYLKFLMQNPAETPPTATHIEIVLWRKEEVSFDTDSQAHERVLIPVLSTAPGYEYDPATVELVETIDEFLSIYFWFHRFVTIQPQTQEYIEVFPAEIYGFTTETEVTPGGPLEYLLGLPGVGTVRGVIPDLELPPHVQAEFQSTGTAVKEKPIPDLPDDEDLFFDD